MRAFSMKAFSDEPKANAADIQQKKYLPLVIKRNKGSCYSLPH
jgi:hypothetical protein